MALYENMKDSEIQKMARRKGMKTNGVKLNSQSHSPISTGRSVSMDQCDSSEPLSLPLQEEIKKEVNEDIQEPIDWEYSIQDEIDDIKAEIKKEEYEDGTRTTKAKTGRKRKYFSEEDRLLARREQARQRYERIKKNPRQLKKEKKKRQESDMKSYRKRMEMMTEEQRELYQLRQREARIKHYEKYREEICKTKHVLREAMLAKMSEEEKAEYYRKLREKNANLTEEQKKKRAQQTYFQRQAKLAEMTEEERKEASRKSWGRLKAQRDKLGERRRELYEEKMRQDPEQLRKRERALERRRNRVVMETPQERQRRLRRFEINRAVRKLRKELGSKGVPPEEIQVKVEGLRRKMKEEELPPPVGISEYAPKPRRMLNCGIGGVQFDCESGGLKLSEIGVKVEELDVTMEVKMEENNIFDEGGEDGDAFIAYAIATPSLERGSQSTPASSQILNCPHCTSSFLRKGDLTSHINSEHPKKECWQCTMCKNIMASPAELKKHFQSKHAPVKRKSNQVKVKPRSRGIKDVIISCMKCKSQGQAFKSQNDLKEHVKSEHPELYWPCSKCDLLKYSERSLRTHERTCGKKS